jgi:four helix bundle protein
MCTKSFTDLDVWKEGVLLLKEVYAITRKFPPDERFELTSQLRRSTKSILGNIAEGFGKYTYADKAAKYVIARGECTETEAHLLMATSLNFATKEEIEPLIKHAQEIGRMLSGLILSMRKRSAKQFPSS